MDRIIRETGPERVAAFIGEPVSGATLGAVVPPDDYWPEVAAVLRSHGVLLIADEVMTGFGRTGRWFGMDNWGVRPDILTSGKGASSGYWPLGLCVASGHVYDTVDAADTFSHGFTWSHHPVGAAAADAVLEVIQREGLVERSRMMGERCRERLRAALSDHPHVGDIRGIGLMNAVEFVADRNTKEPFPRSHGATEGITGAAFERGPPLSVTEDDLDAMVDRLADSVVASLPR